MNEDSNRNAGTPLEERTMEELHGGRFSGLYSFLNSSAKAGSRWSWGLFLLLAFAVYAIVNLVVIILKIF